MRYEVLTVVKMMMMFFWVMSPCRLYVSLKWWYLRTSLHGAVVLGYGAV
jgi:hypothetical protein